MPKTTTPDGKVYQAKDKPSLQAYLYDFDIDGHGLKPAHTQWLDTKVVEQIRRSGKSSTNARWYIWLFGNASRTADEAHNLQLSSRRAHEVEKYLSTRLAGTPHQVIVVPLGEAKAMWDGWPDNIEFEFYRSVTLAAEMHVKQPPIPKLVPPPVTPNPAEFRIRLTEVAVAKRGFSLGPLVDIDTSLVIVRFEIMNVAKCEVAPYRIVDMAGEVGLGSGLPIPDLPEYQLWNKPTQWQDFKATTKPAGRADAFTGWGRVLDVDERSLKLRLSRDNPVALDGTEFSFRNPQRASRELPLKPLPGLPLENLIGAEVKLDGKLQSCK